MRTKRVGMPQLWIVECKLWRRRLSKLHVEALSNIVQEVGAARAVVNREDPVGLLRFGVEDEYETEIRDLIKWRTAVTAEQVSSVFLRWFGESGAMPSDMAARIADGINAAHAEHLST